MLIDTNIILEILFKQENGQDCLDLLDLIDQQKIPEKVYLTKFSLSAIQAACKKGETEFLKELLLLIYQNKIRLCKMDITDDLMINSVRKDLGLDFDDAMQFVAAQKAGTYIVTYDKHFIGKPIQIKSPKQVLKKVLKQA